MSRKGRTSMDRSVQILEMRRAGHSQTKIAEALKMCPRTVKMVFEKYKDSAPTQPLQAREEPQMPAWLRALDSDYLIKEARKGVPYRILFNEQGKLPVKYWTFWQTLKKFSKVEKDPSTTMRLRHKPGEKAFVDYTDGIDLFCIKSGEVTSTQLFVGTLPFSSLVCSRAY